MKQLVPHIEKAQSASLVCLQWEEFCDLLGGASWSEICSRWSAEDLNAEAREYLPSLATRFTERQQFHFADSKGAIAPLETLWLKWRLFATLCGCVLSIHSETQRPLLNLQPSNFRVVFPENIDPLLPARWQYTVQIADSAPADPFVPEGMPSGTNGALFRPTAGMSGIFQSPEIRGWPLGQSAVSTVLIRSIELIRNEASVAETVQGRVRLHILEDSFPASAFSDKDLFHVSLPIINGKVPSVAVWGKKVESAERGLVIDGKTEPTDMMTWQHLQALQHEVWNHAKILVYRSFHVPCDLYSLGMLSLRTILGIREPVGHRVESILPDVMEAIQKIVKSVGTDSAELLNARLASLLKDYGALFNKRALLYPGVRAQSGMMMVSDDLWDEVVLFAFRLMTRITGFSFCRHAGDYPKDHPQGLMEDVMSEVIRIGEDLNAELFGPRQRNREILSVCQQLREERLRAN